MPRLANTLLSAALICSVLGATPVIFAGDTPAGTTDTKATNTTRHALERPLPDVKFNATPLSDVLDFLADSTEINMSVDWKALDAAHVAKDTPITLRMSTGVALHKALRRKHPTRCCTAGFIRFRTFCFNRPITTTPLT
jgi:hypothetical protein